MAESYYPISPYAYCAGDPVNRVDPEGERVRIWFYDNTGVRRSILYSGESITHSNAFVNSVIKAYQYNKTNWIKVGYIEDSPTARLVEREEIINIVDAGTIGDHFSDAYNTIYWNPKVGHLSNSAVFSPASAFDHEADHANDYLDDPVAHINRRSTPDKSFKNKEERRVITNSEQKTAVANGEIKTGQKTRTTYNQKEIIIKGGVSSTIIDKNETILYYQQKNKDNQRRFSLEY